MSVRLLSALACVCVWILATPAAAAEDRITLLFTGDACPANQAAVERAVLSVPGVIRVDPRTVPDHLLVDVQRGVTADTIVDSIRALPLDRARCTVEEMKSCITAEMK